MGKYSEYDRASLSFAWRAAAWIVVAVLFFGGLSWLIWGAKVFSSDIRGAGDATVTINSGANRIAAQERFHALNAKIVEYELNLKQACQDKLDNPGDQFHATNYSGMVMQYNQAVAEYNAATQMARMEKWLDAGLPSQIIPVDLVDYCKKEKP